MDSDLIPLSDSPKTMISHLEANKALYLEKYESAPDSTKPIFLQLVLEIEKRLLEIEKQKTVLLQQSRPRTRMSVDSFISPSQEVVMKRVKNYVYQVDGIVAYATVLSANLLATCYHCVKHCITTGPDVDELLSHRIAVIGLTHAVTNRKVQAKIGIYSIENDVVLLQTDENLLNDVDLLFRAPYLGQPYFLLGTPISDEGNPLQVISGRVSLEFETELSSFCHLLEGHGSARPGASGGPVFAQQLSWGKLTLLGIVLAGQNISHETRLSTFVSSNYVKILSVQTLNIMKCMLVDGKFKL